MDKDMNVFGPVILTDNDGSTPAGYDMPEQPRKSDDSGTDFG